MNNKSSQILIVDDVADNLLMMQNLLGKEGYCVSTYDNGNEAIASILASPPDLILLDVMMPNLDGYEVTFKIRSQPHLPYIPILLICADESQNLANGLDLGADDFLYEPLKINDLLARVRSLLRLKYSIDAMEEMTKAREDFISRLANDLRTPLVAADRMLFLLQKGTFGELIPEAKKAIAAISESNQNLLALVNTLLEVHRFEAGYKRLVRTRFNLTKMIQQVVEELKPLANAKGLCLTYSQPDLTPIKIMGDGLDLRRVVTNLVGNAIKFTDSNYVNEQRNYGFC
ncbi:response regulator [Aerosakkonemataceae cyanobacterium BLCC-F50]|uniref:histidine kinase n=1 Tax=Floridaenema flaviceps BLCC-F50 TaxID=3153642 RepID=A0ABV4Y1A9_9CYAN